MRRLGKEQDLPLKVESVAYLTKECFLKQLASLPGRKERSNLQDAIVRSLYWFADAHGDRNPTMQFVKLWSCAECFFAIEKGDVTELNARGIAAVLAFAGFRVVALKEYPEFKRRIKYLYDLRSEAVHRARFGHIEVSDLEDFSRWVAWIIISMAALSEKGFKTSAQIKEQTSRLDLLTFGADNREGLPAVGPETVNAEAKPGSPVESQVKEIPEEALLHPPTGGSHGRS